MAAEYLAASGRLDNEMKKRVVREILGAFIGLFAIVYVIQLLINMGSELPATISDTNTDRHKTVAIFGATGTAGDGLLKAAMNDPDVQRIHVITRRLSPRIEAGVASGLVTATLHMDYLDYSAVRDVFADVDTVYWAIGLSGFGLDEEIYCQIHLNFPCLFVAEWMSVTRDRDMSFHYISGNAANANSLMMWGREKAYAEGALFESAEDSNLRVISYRPCYIAPTKEQSHFSHNALYAFLAPINFAVRATAIGQAMLEVSARGPRLKNGMIIGNNEIIGYSNAYQQRRSSRE